MNQQAAVCHPQHQTSSDRTAVPRPVNTGRHCLKRRSTLLGNCTVRQWKGTSSLRLSQRSKRSRETSDLSRYLHAQHSPAHRVCYRYRLALAPCRSTAPS
jgi:hypothetical protein